MAVRIDESGADRHTAHINHLITVKGVPPSMGFDLALLDKEETGPAMTGSLISP